MSTGFHDVRPSPTATAPDPALGSAWGSTWARSPSRYAAAIALCVAAGAASLAFDVPLAEAMVRGKVLRPLHDVLAAFEPFGQPTAVLVVAAAIAVCDARRRVAMPRLIAAALGSGLAADLVKLLVARTRPHHFDLIGSVFETFRGFAPGAAGSALQSCPSAHTATAVGFALALTSLFPAGRPLFVSLAALVALQRIEGGAHYLSDTCWGAAVGSTVCLAVFHPALWGRWFDRKEAEWACARDADDRPVRERLSVVTAEGEAIPPGES